MFLSNLSTFCEYTNHTHSQNYEKRKHHSCSIEVGRFKHPSCANAGCVFLTVLFQEDIEYKEPYSKAKRKAFARNQHAVWINLSLVNSV